MFLGLNNCNDRFTLTEKEMAVRGGAAQELLTGIGFR